MKKNQTEDLYKENIDDVVEKIKDLKATQIKKTIEKMNVAHISLIIYEIITYFYMLSNKEVREVFKKLNLDFSIFPKCFLLLNALGLVYEYKYISTKYYFVAEVNQYIQFSFHKYIDKLKFLDAYRETLKSETENKKRKALNALEKRNRR